MSKTVKAIIGLSAALVVLGGGFAVLKLTEPKDNEESSSVSSDVQQAKLLIYDDKVTGSDPVTGADIQGVIKTVDVVNKDDVLHVVQKTTKTDESAATYTLDGYQDVVMNDSVIGTLANNINGLASTAIIEENCSDPSRFGIDASAIQVEVVYETGTKHTMRIGNKAPSGDVTYVMVDGYDTVFTVTNALVANFSKTTIELVETTMLKTPEEYPTVEKLTIERDNLDEEIVLEFDKKNSEEKYSGGTSSSHVMTKPTTAYLAVEKSTDLITGMFGLYANDVYAVHCTDSDIAEAGLKEAFCRVTMECDDGNDYKLLLSEPFSDGNGGKSCYGMFEDGNVIFVLSVDKVKWVTVNPVDIASRIFIASYVWNVTDLSVKCGSDSYDFNISRINPDQEVDKLLSEDFDTTLNGEKFDTERYRQFYSFLISANAEDFALGEEIPKSEPLAEVRYSDKYTGKTTELKFYEKSPLQTLVTVDGESKFTVSKSFVDTLVYNAGIIKTDEEYKKTWK